MGTLFSVLFYLQIMIYNEATTNELKNRANTIAHVLVSSVQKAFVNNEFNELNKVLEQVGKQKEMAYLAVYDNVGTKISEMQDTLLIPVRTNTFINLKEGIQDIRINNLELTSITIPVIEDGLNWGSLHIVFDQTFIRNQMSVLNNYRFYTFIFGLLIITIASWFLTGFISTPLKKLTDAALNISGGNLDTTVDFSRKDEIGILAKAFNSMASSINSMVRELSSKNKELNEATSRLLWLGRIAQQIGEGVIVTDLGGVITFVNDAWLKIHDYKGEKPIGKHIDVFFTQKQFAKEVLPIFKRVILGKQFSGEVNHVKSDGTEFPTDCTATLLKDNDGFYVGIIQVVMDITQRKENEKQLIVEKERAKEASRLKSSFLANMSHELRTPMFGILGYSEVLMESIEDEDNKNMIETIHKSGARLLETLNLILDISKIEADKLELKLAKVDVVKIVKGSINLFIKAAQNKNLTIESHFAEEIMYLEVDERLLREAVNNLINNAVKYTDKGGLLVSIERESKFFEEYLVLKFTDTGIGIPEDHLQTIFDEFRQVSEGFNRNFEGTGLGLSLTKRFVEKMKGHITVNSEIGKGSVFTIKLPIKFTGAGVEKPKVSVQPLGMAANVEEKPAPLKSILLVENDEINQSIIKIYLKGKYKIDIAESGDMAIDAAKKNLYSAILMDINLGSGMNGLDATQIIRTLDNYKETPIVAVTAFAMSGDRQEFLSKGCNHYLAKPFTKDEIVNMLAKIVDNYSAEPKFIK